MKKKVRYFKGGAIKEMDERYAIILVKLKLVEYVEEPKKVEVVIAQAPVQKVITESKKPSNSFKPKQFKGK